MKTLILCIALALSAFTFTATVQADSTEGFSPVADHAAIGGGSSNTVAIAESDRCMYAGLGDKQPLMIASKSEVIDLDKDTNSKTAWSGPYEVGWQS